MKEIKYILGLGVVLAVLDITILGILKVVNSISTDQFYSDLSKTLTVVGILTISAIIVSLITKAFRA